MKDIVNNNKENMLLLIVIILVAWNIFTTNGVKTDIKNKHGHINGWKYKVELAN